MAQAPTSPDPSAFRGAHVGPPLPAGTLIAFLVAVLAIILVAGLSYGALESSLESAQRVTRTLQIVEQLQGILSTLQDAETGQRGFLLTSNETYLAPYNNASAAIDGELANARKLLANNPAQLARLAILERVVSDKMSELAQTVAMKRAGDAAGALAAVRTNRGRDAMERARSTIAEMRQTESAALATRQAEWLSASSISSLVVLGGSALLLVLVMAAALRTSRDHRTRQTQVWIRVGQMGLSARIQGEQLLESLGAQVLAYLAEFLDARVGAVFVVESENRLRRVAGFAISEVTQSAMVHLGEGSLGEAAKGNRVIHMHDVPEDYMVIASSVGRARPREIVITPASVDGIVYGALELGFFRRLRAEDLDLLARISESLGVAVRASRDRTRLEQLLAETQRQGEELQMQQEELRVTNEELEVQADALKESQSQLESQQVQLEQSNSQLEEQAQILEHQRDELARTQVVLLERATELQRANQYKSEFLANMSHELRTPLNSSLILAKILADNKNGNLTDEQVKFANTISAAGNDLLAIINDILDLSKVEAGKVELTVVPVQVAAIIDDMIKSFQPLAEQKELRFNTVVDSSTPEKIETDRQRLSQILKNLLSNALKFTEKGEVALRISGAGNMIAFAVRDTGIGISEPQQAIIFEAFRQADGSTHRKYGGTGLGLTISRDLARLLGGDINVQSAAGRGSTFTLKIPVKTPDATGVRAAVASASDASSSGAYAPSPAAVAPAPKFAAVRPIGPGPIEDDRERLTTDSAVILVVDDDPAFASILRDLVRERGFKCVVTLTAGDGVIAAQTYHPKAVLLDMNLPDHSGLGVLDQLKRNPQTRHIPVHVVSVADYSQEALAMGALGYAIKPVQREEMIDALKRLEAKFSQSRRHVLVLEDDDRQRESIAQLLASDDVQITAVRTAAEALTQLRATTFDCMVMDLNLPDVSGYELLQQMADLGDVSFPPVIVYTGRSLTSEEEQSLRRFSKSIIIKDARSPERLLDEVTLFLHQVESQLPADRQLMLKVARDREPTLEGRRILVVEDDVRNIFALTSLLEPKGAKIEIARNGAEAIEALNRSVRNPAHAIDLVLMDIMMPEMDGITATREIRKRNEWRKLPIIALTAKAMKDDQEKCLAAGANDYIAKPLDVEKLLSLLRVWMPN
jgi:signal transduction histidine kinase/DNA-binding response OmpR family regulator/CHASE3 domain sensor protein